ncbi:MAG: outer membrane beta-barrel protein [Bacteroidota bacterium]|nr:outer membrane beta-barrel protein [Bacteroidota bacterium]
MKSLFLILALILFQGFNASMYSYEPGELSGDNRGLIIGFGGSTFVGSASSGENNKFLPGMILGFFQDFSIKPRFDLEAGIQFSTKGSRLDAVGDLYLHQVVTYLEIPVQATWIILPGEKANLFLAGGTFFGIKLLAFNEVGFPEEINGFDIGLDLAAGVRLNKVRFKLEFKQGLLNVDQSTTQLNYKNLSLSFVAGISF